MSNEFRATLHLKFMGRHLMMLPPTYQSHDPNKMAIIYYSLCGIAATDKTQIETKYSKSREFILAHHKTIELKDDQKICTISGFIGTLTLDFQDNKVITINLSNTLFALLSLRILGETSFFENSKHKRHIGNLVKNCQLPDGSFVSSLDIDNGFKPSPVDSKDLRYTYMAISILYLMGSRSKQDFNEFIDVDLAVKNILNHQTLLGAFGEYNEPHAGYTSCALSALYLLNRSLNVLSESFKSKTISWLVFRQLSNEGCSKFQIDSNPSFDEADNGGFQGRPNKFADTCYAFWCMNSLKLLTDDWKNLIDTSAVLNYLLKTTQNTLIGGFSKNDDDDPDIYHTCLGIAALKLLDGSFDGSLCIPKYVSDTMVL
ncbi:hypothetical protein TBLA_0B06120 [Henningerozyma blattae CBS 6284]|uniref:Prenyltransferase alpha-alpha toroid domain-containing protein n=1 Tax=Henningerozyma blattae (strain ATCC 34711 / CBS 6284 / DSM 70876 / NBRC 10599 / NRRL Y-10934 / UCD 77-7) TaxID=1071380 RepID=I2GZ86_HENB6|nr:hypothetical protein TBLA_0B06120 [Tetrapisispora blattae CBS 6284]CCH59438.1 hypothetical protein TBLA_0B06120 [Tetrapisispora blattae CBS 6284]